MRTLTIHGKTVRVYDSVDELPIVNFQKYNKYLLIDSGIGSDVDDIDAHIAKVARFVTSGDRDKALQELQNMRQCFYMVANNISPRHMAFAALVHSVDGREVTDLSDEGLKALLDGLRKVKRSALVDLLMRFKKKVDDELDTYFPGSFVSAKEKANYDRLKEMAMLMLEEASEGSDNGERISEIDDRIFGMYKPKSFDGTGSAEVEYDKSYESACLLITQKTGADAKKMTVLQFYNALEVIREQAEAEAKRYGSLKNRRH